MVPCFYLWETLSYVYRYEWDTPAVFSCGILSRRCAPPKAITLSVNLNPKRARPPAGVFSGWCGLPCGVAQTRPPTEAAFYRLKRAKYLVCNIYDATLKIIAVAKAKANIVIHICSSIAWQAGARTVSQPPAPGYPRLVGRAAADDSGSMRLMLKTSETFVRHWQNRGKPESRSPAPSDRSLRQDRSSQKCGLVSAQLGVKCALL